MYNPSFAVQITRHIAEKLDFRAVMKSAANTASRNPGGAACGRPLAEPSSMGSLGILGGCASSQLDRGLKRAFWGLQDPNAFTWLHVQAEAETQWAMGKQGVH